jgi:hypothetical protein
MTLATCLAHGNYLLRALGRQAGSGVSQPDAGLPLSAFNVPAREEAERIERECITVIQNPIYGLKRLLMARSQPDHN